MRLAFSTVSLAALALLSACGESQPGAAPTDLKEVKSDGELEVARRALPAGDFLDLKLGARIVGPSGDEVATRMTNEAGAFADMTSYVACPAGFTVCDPATLPAGTVYTYVHVVYPGEDNDPTTGSGTGNDSSNVESATLFRLIRPARGFTGNAGYAKAEALAAIGEDGTVVISCEGEALAWTIDAGDGGDQWKQAEPITFYWQSTVPPAGPSRAYEIFANDVAAQGSGPYPADNPAAGGACPARPN